MIVYYTLMIKIRMMEGGAKEEINESER